jgi:hypothetical protein
MPAARALARSYDQAASAFWRGDAETARRFDDWLAAFWDETGPAEPVGQASEISVLGGSGRGIRWYATESTVLGYVPGRGGCYRVPASAIGSGAGSPRVRAS